MAVARMRSGAASRNGFGFGRPASALAFTRLVPDGYLPRVPAGDPTTAMPNQPTWFLQRRVLSADTTLHVARFRATKPKVQYRSGVNATPLVDPRFATARAVCSSFSSAIFCASMTSPIGRFPSGPRTTRQSVRRLHRARRYSSGGHGGCDNVCRHGSPYSNCPLFSYWASCAGESPASDIDTGVVDGPEKALDPYGRLDKLPYSRCTNRACLKSANERNPLARERAACEGRSE